MSPDALTSIRRSRNPVSLDCRSFIHRTGGQRHFAQNPLDPFSRDTNVGTITGAKEAIEHFDVAFLLRTVYPRLQLAGNLTVTKAIGKCQVVSMFAHTMS